MALFAMFFLSFNVLTFADNMVADDGSASSSLRGSSAVDLEEGGGHGGRILSKRCYTNKNCPSGQYCNPTTSACYDLKDDDKFCTSHGMCKSNDCTKRSNPFSLENCSCDDPMCFCRCASD